MRRYAPFACLLGACAHTPPPLVTTVVPPPPLADEGSDAGGTHAPLEARVFADVELVERARGFVVDALLVASAVDVPAGRCALIDVAVARGVRDADLEVFDAGGHLLASDREPARLAAAVVCSRRGEAVHAVARAAEGAGEIAIRTAIVDESASALEVLAPSARAQDTASPADRFVGAATSELESRGFDSHDEVRRFDARAGEESAFAIDWPRGECVSIVARAASGRLSLALDATASGDRTLVRDAGEARDLRVEACVSTPGTATVRVVSTADGAVSVLVARGRAVRVGGRASLRYGE